MGNLKYLRELFKNPHAESRSAPFWSWNDELRAEELVRQVGDMKEHGMGGFFMHSREGLETVYMGPEWMNCVRETVKAAEQEGMEAWIYDEDRWPSGAAGGLVPAKGGDAFRSKGITIEVVKDNYKDDGKVLVLFKAAVEGEKLLKCERLDPKSSCAPGENEVLLVFRREVAAACEWFNDDAPSDNLNPESVKAFIDTTYEVYRQEVGEHFGKAVPGVFTDEPNIAHGRSVYPGNLGWIPWTDGLSEYFRDKRGYDFLDVIPYIFFIGEKSPKVRHDYWRTISDRFCEAYTKQIGDWCGTNNLAFTGHFLLENDMGSATRVSGSIMPHYRYQHVPGIDMLCEQTHEHLTVKQCSSVANQYGRKRVLSETYGCTGWDFTFEGQKWVGDWQYVLGVNLRCQHLALYTLKGCRKRDYPPVFNYNTSWWKYNNIVEDYFARIGAVMSQGSPVRDILVLHPASTAWSMLGCDVETSGDGWNSSKNIKDVNFFSEEFNEFLRYLLGIHYDFDLGDETIMAEAGRIDGDKIYVNLAGYSVVVIPPQVRTMFGETVKLLKDFMDAGGRVIAVEPLADMVEGEKSIGIDDIFTHSNINIVENKGEMGRLLEKLLPREISIGDRFTAEIPEFLYMLRDLPDCRSLFVVNNDRSKGYDVNISVKDKGSIEEWDLLTGEIKEVSVLLGEDRMAFEAAFGPADSKLYIIRKDKEPKISETGIKKEYFNYHKPREIHAALGPVSSFTRTMPNALTLDKCSFRMNEDLWSGEMDVWQAQRQVREALGMRQIYYNGLPQRYKWVNKPHPKDGTSVQLRFVFNVEKIPETTVYLVLETARDYRVVLNGQDIKVEPEGWFMDRAFDKIPLPKLRQGLNEIILSCSYLNRMEIEDCYIIGDFGVDPNRNIVEEPEMLHFGDWCLQGYFHYCGSIIYHFDLDYNGKAGEKAILELGDYSAITVEVRVNGMTAGHIPWRAANGLDISGLIKTGVNKIDIEVMGSPRNLFGPLHQANTKHPYHDWRPFRREGSEYTPNYFVKPYGLFGGVSIYRK